MVQTNNPKLRLNSNNNFKPRFIFLYFIVTIIGLVVIGRLFDLQIIKALDYKEKANRQFVTPKNLLFNRGTIYFVNKNGERPIAASMQLTYKITINPKQIKEPEIVFEQLNNITPIDKDDFFKKADRKTDPYEEIKNRLSEEDAKKIDNLKITGVSVYKEKWRFYPGGDSASQVIGFVGFKGDILIGRYGIERQYEKVLSRTNDGAYVNFFAEVFSTIGKSLSKTNNEEGDIVLSIDSNVQKFAEEQVAELTSKYSAEMAGVIVMDPQTGEIIAMASYPRFNPNDSKDSNALGLLQNPLVERVYEYGSVIKPLVMAGAIDEGIITPETRYTDNGTVTVADKTIKNFDSKARGNATMQMVLDQSLNTGMVYVQQKMGTQLFRTKMLNYELDKKTGIDLPGEVSGITSNLKGQGPVGYATASFGQGIAFSSISAVKAFSSIANGGYLVTPTITRGYLNKSGTVVPFEKTIPKQILKPETSKTVTNMMVHVYEQYGNGSYKMDHYSIAAKTGTAQIAKEGGGGYEEGKHTHSFFAFFPASKPKYLVFYTLRDPRGASFASQTLIGPFTDLTKYLIHYYEIPPDR